MQVTDARGMSAVEIAALMRKKLLMNASCPPEYRQVLLLCLAHR